MNDLTDEHISTLEKYIKSGGLASARDLLPEIDALIAEIRRRRAETATASGEVEALQRQRERSRKFLADALGLGPDQRDLATDHLINIALTVRLQRDELKVEVDRLRSGCCPACDGDCERLYDDGCMHICTVCRGTGKKS